MFSFTIALVPHLMGEVRLVLMGLNTKTRDLCGTNALLDPRVLLPTVPLDLYHFITVHVFPSWYNCFNVFVRVYFLICSCSVPQVDIIRSNFYLTSLSDRNWRSSVFS